MQGLLVRGRKAGPLTPCNHAAGTAHFAVSPHAFRLNALDVVAAICPSHSFELCLWGVTAAQALRARICTGSS
jgi:hypothetical protein